MLFGVILPAAGELPDVGRQAFDVKTGAWLGLVISAAKGTVKVAALDDMHRILPAAGVVLCAGGVWTEEHRREGEIHVRSLLGLIRRNMTYKERLARISEAKQILQHHHARERISRAWTFHRVYEDGGFDSNLAYSVTWTPGSITLAGDLDEMVITHYQATRTLEGAATWLRGARFEYLMEKSDKNCVIQPRETADWILNKAQEHRADALRGGRMPFHQWLPVEVFPNRGRVYSIVKIGQRYFECHEGLELWLRIWCEVSDYGKPRIATRAGREDTARALRARIEEMRPDEIADLCRDLCLDDFHGVYDYPERCLIQYAALQRWAEHVVLHELQREVA